MDLRNLLMPGGTPRGPMLIGIPLAAFFVAVGLVMAFSNGNDSGNTAAVPTVPVSVAQSQPIATATAVPPSPVPDRTSCDAIRGTDYRSESERQWFQQNCNTQTATTSTGTTTTTTTTSSAPRPAAVTGAQPYMGERLVIPKIGVNADVHRGTVVNGVMADPTGYFNVLWYDFTGYPGLGGHPTTGGNTVIAGHVDSAVYGIVVFYYIRNLVAGDVIEYYAADGSYHKYAVTSVGDYPNTFNFAQLVGSSVADLTIITCSGTFDTSVRNYSHRRVVFAQKL